MAGSSCPVEVMREVIDRMNMREVTIAYGMTETSPVSFQSRTDDDIDVRVSTVGSIMPHVECKLVDPETGQVVPRGTAGELCVRGYAVMLGYWNDEEATRSTLDNAGIGYREIPIFTVRMEDKPGQAASTSRRLTDAGVNIEFWLPVDTSPTNFIVALGVDNLEAARNAVSEQITDWTYA